MFSRRYGITFVANTVSCLLAYSISLSAYAITITSASIQHDGYTQSGVANDSFNENDTGGSLNQIICANGIEDTTSPCPTSAAAAANLSSNITTTNTGFAYIVIVNQSGNANLDDFVAGATSSGGTTITVQLDEEASYTLQGELAVNCSVPSEFNGNAQASISPSFGGMGGALADCDNPTATINQSGTLPPGPVLDINTSGTASFVEPVASGDFDLQYTLTIFLAPEENVPLPLWSVYGLAGLLLTGGLIGIRHRGTP